jgi:hypothetical protein
MKKVQFKDIEIGKEFCQMGLTYIKKSSKTAFLKNGNSRDWDYFSQDEEIKIEDKR